VLANTSLVSPPTTTRRAGGRSFESSTTKPEGGSKMAKKISFGIAIATTAAAMGVFAGTSASATAKPSLWCQRSNPYVQTAACHGRVRHVKVIAQHTTTEPRRQLAVVCRNPYTGAVVKCL
jgi:hypothetical protein